MGNDLSTGEVRHAVDAAAKVLTKGGDNHHPGQLASCTFASQVDYTDASVQSLLPPSPLGGQGSSAPPRVSCLMTSAAVSSSPARMAALERSLHVLRTTHHPGLFRVVSTPDSAGKWKTDAIVGTPQIAMIAPNGIASLDSWSVSEMLAGLASIVDTVRFLTASHRLVAHHVLSLHQIGVALQGSPGHRLHLNSNGMVATTLVSSHSGTTSTSQPSASAPGSNGVDWISAAHVNAGRWLLFDLTSFEPHNDGKPSWHHTLRAVTHLILELLAVLLRSDTHRADFIGVAMRAAAPLMRTHSHSIQPCPDVNDASPMARSTSSTPSSPATAHDAPVHLPSPNLLPMEERQPSETMDVVHLAHDTSHATGRIGSQNSHQNSHVSSGPSVQLLAARRLESAREVLVEQLLAVASRGLGGEEVSRRPPSHRSPSSSPVPSHIGTEEGDRTPPPLESDTQTDATAGDDVGTHATAFGCGMGPPCDCGMDALVDWIGAAIEAPGDMSREDCCRSLQRLHLILTEGLHDPVCALLQHGSQLYLYASSDEVSKEPSLVQAAYDAMLEATSVIHRYFMAAPNAPSASACTGAYGSGGAAGTVWARRITPWLMHTSQVGQPQATQLMDYVFQTVGTPCALLSDSVLTDVAMAWLVQCKNPICHAAALRYARWLIPALPLSRRVPLLTTTSFTMFQGRRCLRSMAAVAKATASTDGEMPTEVATLPLPLYHATLSLVTASVKALPILLESLGLSSPRRRGAAISTRAPNREAAEGGLSEAMSLPLAEMLWKELLLVFRCSVAAIAEDLLSCSANRATRWFAAVDRLQRSVVLTLMELVAREGLAAADGSGDVTGGTAALNPLTCLGWCLSHGALYGTMDQRERFVSFASAALWGNGDHDKTNSVSAVLLRSLTTSNHEAAAMNVSLMHPMLVLRWWLPLVTPLCAVRDAPLRRAACVFAGHLTSRLRTSAEARDSSVPATAARTAERTLFQVVTNMDAELAATHGSELNDTRPTAAAWVESYDALLQSFASLYQRRVFSAAHAVSQRFTDTESGSDRRLEIHSHGAHILGALAPVKEYVTSTEAAKSALIACFGRIRLDHDHVLLPLTT